MTDSLPDAGSFGAAFEDFMRAMTAAAERPESDLALRIREHLGTDPNELPVTVAQFHSTDHPNLQLALDAVLPDAEILGYTTRNQPFAETGLAEVLAGQGMAGPIRPGPVQYTDIAVGDGRVVQCISAGLYLAHQGDAPVALVLVSSQRPFGGSGLSLQGI